MSEHGAPLPLVSFIGLLWIWGGVEWGRLALSSLKVPHRREDALGSGLFAGFCVLSGLFIAVGPWVL